MKGHRAGAPLAVPVFSKITVLLKHVLIYYLHKYAAA